MSEFGFMVDSNFLKAWEELIKSKIIIETNRNSGKSFILNTWEKATEIRNIFVTEPIPERAINVKPDKKYFENLVERFTHTTENAWPNQGTYYFCTREDDVYDWIVFFRSKPNKRHTTYNLGSIKDENSTISTMWKVIVNVWKDNEKQPVYKKMAEDRDQKTFGNNRQPATAGFAIFLKFGWIQEVSRRGKQIFYQIKDEEQHNKIIYGKIPMCPRCGLPAPGQFCLNCDQPI